MEKEIIIILWIIISLTVSVKSQTTERHLFVGKYDTVQALLLEDIIFYVRDCAKDSVLIKVDPGIYEIDKKGNRIKEYYEFHEPTFKDFAIWLGKKYYTNK